MAEQLEIDENRSFQETFWTIQRWAWVGYGVIICGALLGLAGEGGVFARAQVQAGSSQIDYPRLSRWQTEETISITFAAAKEAHRSVLLSPAFGRSLAIEGAQPVPSQSSATMAGEEVMFRVRPGEPGVAKIRIKPDVPGIIRGTISIDGSTADVTLIILP